MISKSKCNFNSWNFSPENSFPGSSLSCAHSEGQVGENAGNEMAVLNYSEVL